MKAKINALAHNFYTMKGRKVDKDYDFSKVTHPEEQMMWNQAVVAWAVLKDDNDALRYQYAK